MGPGFVTFFVLASIAVLALCVLDLYLGSKFHLEKLRDKNKMLKRTKDH